MRTFLVGILFVLIAPCFIALAAETPDSAAPPDMQVYEVNKTVADFPETEDFSTPEAAYAVVNRVIARGEEGSFRHISLRSLADRLPPADTKTNAPKPEDAKRFLDARILEVRIFQSAKAVALAELPRPSGESFIDVRFFGLENGKWLNNGENYAKDLDEAREQFVRSCALSLPMPKREPVADPDKFLAPFVDFLKANAEDPLPFAMNAIKSHRLVIMGEIHHRPAYWALNTSLVKDHSFPDYVGAIYLELPMNDQPLVDEFLAAPSPNPAPVIQMLRDMMEFGWPDKPTLDFFTAVWQANSRLRPEKRIRIVLADMQRPWKEILQTGDFRKYDVDRNALMAENILKDMKDHADDKRSGLFIVGAGHAMKNLEYLPGCPDKSAGWRLVQGLGKENVFVFFPHTASMTNVGEVHGRLCLGLFDSAFAALDNKPAAFPLAGSPFGKEPFDAFPDDPLHGTFADGYDAYVYLGPLEKEIFSPLIPGFYTDDFVKEIDQRYMLNYKKSWSEMYKRQPTAANFVAWLGNAWGKPRGDWSLSSLGPIDAWQLGDAAKNRPKPVALRAAEPGDVTVSGKVLASKTITDLADIRIRLDLGPWQFVAMTDAAGRFTASLPKGRHRLIAYLPDNERMNGAGGVDVTVTASTKDVSLQLSDLPMIRVRVLDQSGGPVEGVVTTANWNKDLSGVGFVGTPTDTQGISIMYIYPGENMYVGAFDRAGKYRFVPPKDFKPVTMNSGETRDMTVTMSR